MRFTRTICTLLFGVAVLLFFGLAYPHHLHYQEQYQLFLFDSNYVCEIIKHTGGVADLLGRFCTQFFLRGSYHCAVALDSTASDTPTDSPLKLSQSLWPEFRTFVFAMDPSAR